MCCILLHLQLLKISGLPITPGGGKITFGFMVMLAGTSVAGLSTSMMSTVNEWESKIAPHSAIKVCEDTVSKHLPSLLSKPLSIVLAKQSCLSQIQSVSGRNKCICGSSHALCYRRMRLCAIHSSFVAYMVGMSFRFVVLTRLYVCEPGH